MQYSKHKKNFVSSFRLNTGRKSKATTSILTQAQPGTKYETIYRTKMDNSSFNGDEKSINKTIQESNQAYFGRSSQISGHECEVKDIKTFSIFKINLVLFHYSLKWLYPPI